MIGIFPAPCSCWKRSTAQTSASFSNHRHLVTRICGHSSTLQHSLATYATNGGLLGDGRLAYDVILPQLLERGVSGFVSVEWMGDEPERVCAVGGAWLNRLPQADSIAMSGTHWVHDLDPFAFQISEGVGLRWYGLAYLAGIAIGWWLMRRWSRKGLVDITTKQADDIVLYLGLGIILGGRLGQCTCSINQVCS